MKDIKDLSVEDIGRMDYNQIIGLVKETNRPPGGKNSLFEIMNRIKITKDSKILEVGTSTGFTPIEISRLVKCNINSVDINEESLKEAKKRADFEGYININFSKADVNNLPFEEGTFDLVIVGNVFSLMKNKRKALKECLRVCKKDGFIAAIPMYYLEKPSKDLIQNVSDAIKVKIDPLYKSNWIDFFLASELDIYWSKDFRFDYIGDKRIEEFCEEILQREHLNSLNEETYKKLHHIYKEYMFLFRENLSRMGYTILILSKRKIWEDSELYTSIPIEKNGR